MTTRPNHHNLIEQVLNLPRTHEMVIPAEYLDLNGHMNVMYYTAVGNMGLVPFFGETGIRAAISDNPALPRHRGMFALRQVLSYLNELREGERVAVHTGLLGYDTKRVHFMHYIISLDKNRVAATDERVAIYIDLTNRRSTNFEPEIMEKLATVKARFDKLDWHPVVSGAIQLKPLNEG